MLSFVNRNFLLPIRSCPRLALLFLVCLNVRALGHGNLPINVFLTDGEHFTVGPEFEAGPLTLFDNAISTDLPGVAVLSPGNQVPDGTELRFDVLSGVTYWDGQQLSETNVQLQIRPPVADGFSHPNRSPIDQYIVTSDPSHQTGMRWGVYDGSVPGWDTHGTFSKHYWIVIRVALLNFSLGVGFYAAFVYSVTYMQTQDHLPESEALNLNTLSMVALLCMIPISAWFSDRWGRKSLMIAGNVVLLFGAVPFLHLMHSEHPVTIFLGVLGFVVAIGILAGGIGGANVELMPASIRYFFGGTTPLIASLLNSTTGDPISPAWWIAFAGLVSLLTAILLIPETRYKSLEE